MAYYAITYVYAAPEQQDAHRHHQDKDNGHHKGQLVEYGQRHAKQRELVGENGFKVGVGVEIGGVGDKHGWGWMLEC